MRVIRLASNPADPADPANLPPCPCGNTFEYLMDDKLRAREWTRRHPTQGLPPGNVSVCMACGRYYNPERHLDPAKWEAQKAVEKTKSEQARRPVRQPNESKEHWEARERLGPDTRTDWSGAVTTPGDRD